MKKQSKWISIFKDDPKKENESRLNIKDLI